MLSTARQIPRRAFRLGVAAFTRQPQILQGSRDRLRTEVAQDLVDGPAVLLEGVQIVWEQGMLLPHSSLKSCTDSE